MKNQSDPIGDHMLGVTFENIRCPIERVKFFRANKAAIGRESARREAGRPLPAAPRIVAKVSEPRRGLTVMRAGKVVSHIPSRYVTAPSGGLFGTAKRQ